MLDQNTVHELATLLKDNPNAAAVKLRNELSNADTQNIVGAISQANTLRGQSNNDYSIFVIGVPNVPNHPRSPNCHVPTADILVETTHVRSRQDTDYIKVGPIQFDSPIGACIVYDAIIPTIVTPTSDHIIDPE
jgi:hypothetical protein